MWKPLKASVTIIVLFETSQQPLVNLFLNTHLTGLFSYLILTNVKACFAFKHFYSLPVSLEQ